MQITKIKNCYIVSNKKRSTDRGFVILFAVTIASILLMIALGVQNIAFKELKFTTSAKNSNDAFFAADMGVECALINNQSTSTTFVTPNPSSEIVCNTASITVTENPTSFWSFTMVELGSTGEACAKVTVDKTTSTTTIISRGYNTGDASCASSNPNRTERELDVTY